MSIRRNRRNYSRGFSLTELMVAMFLGMIITGLVFFAFSQASTASSKSLALVESSQKITAFTNRLDEDIASMYPGADVVVTISATEKSILFCRVLSSLDEDYNGTADVDNNLAWVKYRYDIKKEELQYGRKIVTSTFSPLTATNAGTIYLGTMLKNVKNDPTDPGGVFQIISKLVGGVQQGINAPIGVTTYPATLSNGVLSGSFPTSRLEYIEFRMTVGTDRIQEDSPVLGKGKYAFTQNIRHRVRTPQGY